MGIETIQDLTAGSGQPPDHDLQVFAGSILLGLESSTASPVIIDPNHPTMSTNFNSIDAIDTIIDKNHIVTSAHLAAVEPVLTTRQRRFTANMTTMFPEDPVAGNCHLLQIPGTNTYFIVEYTEDRQAMFTKEVHAMDVQHYLQFAQLVRRGQLANETLVPLGYKEFADALNRDSNCLWSLPYFVSDITGNGGKWSHDYHRHPSFSDLHVAYPLDQEINQVSTILDQFKDPKRDQFSQDVLNKHKAAVMRLALIQACIHYNPPPAPPPLQIPNGQYHRSITQAIH
ncbi:hypothetical protein C0991_001341 [Blastosporella zonata]|nr:hypothetical protein C0991_001341 [Blastosporella zonata]